MQPTRKRNHTTGWIAAAIFALALAARLIYLYQISRNPFFSLPLVDSKSYDDAAFTLITSRTMPVQFFWQAFFYPMILSIIYFTAGHSILTVKLVQAVIGSLVCVVVFRLGLNLFTRRTAVLAAVATALYGPLIFFDGELLAASWASLWAIVLLLLFLRLEREHGYRTAVVLGICGGLSIITRATFVPFFAVACIWLARSMHRRAAGWKMIALTQNAILAGALLVLIPVSIQGYRVTGLFSPLPETGPINLYIGNNMEREAIMAIRPGGEWEDIMLMPVREGYRTRSQAQSYFLGRVRSYVTGHPGDFLKRMGRKTGHFFSSREIPNNTDIYANRAYSPLYAVLLWKIHNFGFPFGIVLPFLIIGLVCRWRSIPGVVKLFLLTYPLAIILVFVTARYRAPMLPVILLVAAAGFWRVIDALRARRWSTVAIQCGAIVAIAFLSSAGGPFAAERVNFEAEKYHAAALSRLDRGEIDAAIANLKTAIAYDPGYSEAFQSLGVAYVRKNQLEEAERWFKRALELRPGYYSAHNNLGALLGRQGKYEQALFHLQKALELNPHSDVIYLNIGISLMQLGRHDEAREYIRTALRYAELFGDDAIAARIRNNFGNYVQSKPR